MHMLDMAAINALVLWKQKNPEWENNRSGRQRKEFIFQLAEQLVRPFVERRSIDRPQGLHSSVRVAMRSMGIAITEVETQQSVPAAVQQ